MQYTPEIQFNDKISFITLNFTGIGNNKIDIIATETLVGIEEKIDTTTNESPSENGGCLIATATYGTELFPSSTTTKGNS